MPDKPVAQLVAFDAPLVVHDSEGNPVTARLWVSDKRGRWVKLIFDRDVANAPEFRVADFKSKGALTAERVLLGEHVASGDDLRVALEAIGAIRP